MTQREALSYNQVPYPSLSHYSTHPDQICTLARLLGVPAAAVEGCRVLELGSAAGGNLIPMAYGLPGSEFVGVDISQVQVKQGQKKIKRLGLKNVTLRQMDILDYPAPDAPGGLGRFDYIIAHGVFSWVPPAVQEKLLEVCRASLTPHGVAFISYNTYPGWHMINIARGIMRYHTRDIENPKERADKAREYLQFYAKSNQNGQNGYYGFLSMYADYINGGAEDNVPKYDSALLHDELEDLNQPFYLHEFVARVKEHGLQYLGDLNAARLDSVSNAVLEDVQKKAKDLIELEQMTDFLLNQTFRKTLVCHQEVELNRKVRLEQARNFWYSSVIKPVEDTPDIHGRTVVEFRSTNGLSLKIDHPLSKAAMICLEEAYPLSLTLEELTRRAKAWLEKDGQSVTLTAADLGALAANLLKAYSYNPNLVELHVWQPKQVLQAQERPFASRVARYDLSRQERVTNMIHQRVLLEGLQRFIFPYLDGKHSISQLLNLILDGPVAEGTLTLDENGKQLSKSEQRAALKIELENTLSWLAQASLLVDESAFGGAAHGN